MFDFMIYYLFGLHKFNKFPLLRYKLISIEINFRFVIKKIWTKIYVEPITKHKLYQSLVEKYGAQVHEIYQLKQEIKYLKNSNINQKDIDILESAMDIWVCGVCQNDP
jgi:hypothetical protein